jgi:uncharacterized Rmd1/YagE family protein
MKDPGGPPSVHAEASAPEGTRVVVRADYFEGRIDLKAFRAAFPDYNVIATDPLVISPGDGSHAVLTKFGGLVCWNCSDDLRERIRGEVAGLPRAGRRIDEVSDEIEVVTGEETNRVEFDRITLRRLTPEKLKVISTALAQSVALEFFENRVGEALQQSEPIVVRLRERGGLVRKERKIIQAVGFALEIRSAVLANLTLFDSPPEAWENASVARLVARLYDHFDLEERLSAIKEKVGYLTDLNSTLLDLLSNRKNRNLEWIIIGLIALEILFFVYVEAFIHR